MYIWEMLPTVRMKKKTLLIIQSFIFQVERYYECDALTQYMTLTFFI